ncbi:MAG: alpha/beta hydrolase [Bacillales bacterium]|nr:alpha/beta hydrolase [Bacillales bacterium]
MSLINRIVFIVCKKGRKKYDSKHPFNYKKRRDDEKKQNKYLILPKKVKINRYEENNISYHFVCKETNPKDKIIYYIHGGGFVVGSIETRTLFTTYLAKKLDLNVLAIEYPLAPENPYPYGINACFEGYKKLLEKYSSNKIVLMGESAGGNLVLSLLLKIKDNGLDLPSVAFAFSPCVQFDKELDSYINNYETECAVANLAEEVKKEYLLDNEELLKNPYVSPLYGDFKGMKPIYLYVSTTEYLYDDSVLMYKKLKQDNVETELFVRKGMIHTWITIPTIPEAKKDLKKVKELIKKHIKN